MSNAVSPLQPRLSIVESVARQYGMDPRRFEQTLRATVVPQECTPEQFAAFLLVAKEYGLNPILKEIYAMPTRNGGIQPIVGVDGWAKMIARHEQADGFSFEDHRTGEGDLIAITCKMYRKDRTHPIETTEYFAECNRGTDTWRKWPHRMLRHKAMIQAARYAFGFSGVIDPDEYDRFGATPHDPAMLQAQMQLTGQDAFYERLRTEDLGPGDNGEPELPIDTPGHITTHPDYLAGVNDRKSNRHEPHFEIGEDETRWALWRQGYFSVGEPETEER
jgi:phage recombination protein Bet